MVDDASTDDTPQVVDSFQDERIVYLRHHENRGAAATRNTGIRQARGQFVAFLDDDDEYLPEFLAETYRAFLSASPGVGFGWCGHYHIGPDGNQILGRELWQPRFKSRHQAYLSVLRYRKLGSGCGLTVRRSCFETVGLFDEAMHVSEDADLLIRLFRDFDFVVVPAFLVKVHKHPEPRLSTRNSRYQAETYVRIARKHMSVLQSHPELDAFFNYKIGLFYYSAGDMERGRHYLCQALRRRPFHMKTWINLMLFELFGSRGLDIRSKIRWGLRLPRHPFASSRPHEETGGSE
ncbi:MAG: glycosyl transferase [Litorilinea sp.]|nr:MAG: glycosyl transferase [Litorilinea sp.]